MFLFAERMVNSLKNNIIRKLVFLIIFIVLLGKASDLRLHNLNEYSFWTDEIQTAIFSNAIVKTGSAKLANGYTPGVYLPFWYYFPGASVTLFGQSNFSVRLPSVVFGIITIFFVYFLGKAIFNNYVGLLAAVFTSFLKIEILWSRQARPYQLLQLLAVLSLYFFIKALKESGQKKVYFIIFSFTFGFITFLSHPIGLSVIFSLLIYLLFFERIKIKTNFKYYLFCIFAFIFFCVLLNNLFPEILNHFVKQTFILKNNFYEVFPRITYYRIFFMKNYLSILFIGFLGFLFSLKKHMRLMFPIILWALVHMGLIVFFQDQVYTRYAYPIFPVLIILFSFGLFRVSKMIALQRQYLQLLILSILCLIILTGSDKFSLKKQEFYSLNDDMQEIPEVDYQKIYLNISNKILFYPDTIYISNWNDHAVWYLGEGELDYILRYNKNNLKKEPLSGATYLTSLKDLVGVVQTHPKGIILLESWDNMIPQGVESYVQSNFNEEFKIDRLYPVQPRYWPVTVYSWGI